MKLYLKSIHRNGGGEEGGGRLKKKKKKSGTSERCKNKIRRHVNVSAFSGEGGSGDDKKEIIERK